MAAETIYKLQPNRTIHLRGFDKRGAAAAMVNSSASGFELRGVFRDMADFTVVTLWDADNFFEHPSIKYLPDFDFDGMVLQFDMSVAGVQPIDSSKHNWIDWAGVDYVTESGASGSVKLFNGDTGPAQPLTTRVKATTKFTVAGATPVIWDRVTLWYQNLAFDYVVPGKTWTEYAFYAAGAGHLHSIVVGEAAYVYTEEPDVNSAYVASQLISQMAADPNVTASVGSESYIVRLDRKKDDGAITPISASGNYSEEIHQVGPKWVAQQLTNQINGADYGGVSIALSATVLDSEITVTAAAAGKDGNFLHMYSQSKTSTLTVSPGVTKFEGGVTAAVWRVTLDFSALGLSKLRKLWMTFAPELPDGKSYNDTQWSVVFSNWTVSDPNGKRALYVAGPGSVRVNSRDAWVKYTGAGWAEEAGWFQEGFARRASLIGDTATIRYHCQHTHDLYVGTSLYIGRGTVSVKIDGVAAPDLVTGLAETVSVNSRRRIATAMAAGEHTVELKLLALPGTSPPIPTGPFYFDFLEAAKPGPVPDPSIVYPGVTAAIDYDTDHTYKLPPERLVWNLDRLGLHGQINEYVGVFWWNQRKRVGGVFKSMKVSIVGDWVNGESLLIDFGGTTIGKSVFPKDTPESIASHFVYAINQTFVAVWAEIDPEDSTSFLVHQHSPDWDISTTVTADSVDGDAVKTGSLTGGVEGVWVIDDSATTALNIAATVWHQNLYQQVAMKGWSAVAALSMELVEPPEDLSGGNVFAARYPDGWPVATDTGFASLKSVHCSFTAAMAAYQAKAYTELAALQSAVGLTPWIQFGEFLWWFFSRRSFNVSSITGNEINTSVNHGFQVGEKVIVAGTRVMDGTRTVLSLPSSSRAVLSGPTLPGAWTLSGTIRGGGMGYYDQETTAAAQTALGRPLTVFGTQDDDPATAASDVAFLRSRMKAHIDAIRASVLAAVPNTKFEILFPYDVNHPSCYHTLDLPYPQGGRLNAGVNLPTEYHTKVGSGLDRMKVEALSWSSFYRNLDRSKESIQFATTEPMSWPKLSTAYLMPIFNGGCPWQREFLTAVNEGVPLIVFWAFDHLTLYSWPVPLPKNSGSATIT
jgi:hypothetical protein